MLFLKIYNLVKPYLLLNLIIIAFVMDRRHYSKSKRIIGNLLLKWWENNKRTFSWRRTSRPYNVLIAEMLLRKTTAKQVEEEYRGFIKKYPNPKVLSEADNNELSNRLRPLGMEHKRAQLFLKFGKTIMKEFKGRLPSTKEELLKLPGVGLYATNAVLSFSQNKDVPLVDTNFIRIIDRVFGFKSEKSRARNDKKIWEFATMLVPRGRSREFNLAVLDFAAVLCKAKNPKCDICPLIKYCEFHKKTEAINKKKIKG